MVPGEREWRQPRLAADRPAFIGRHQLVRGIEGAEMHFDFAGAAREDRRAAARTEMPPGVVACLARDGHRLGGKYRRRVEERPMMLAAVEAVTDAHPVGASPRHDPDAAAQTPARV